MKEIVQKIVDFVKSYIPETLIEKIMLAVMSYKSGQLSTLFKRSKKSAESRKSARQAESRIETDKKYRENVRSYFNRNEKK